MLRTSLMISAVMPTPCAATISWTSACTWGSTVTISTVSSAARTSETSATALPVSTPFPPRPTGRLVGPGLRHAIDPITQRPEQEDGPAANARPPLPGRRSAGQSASPARPRVGGGGQAHHGQPCAIALRAAIGRVPFGLRQQDVLLSGSCSLTRNSSACPDSARCDPPNRRGCRAPSKGCPAPDC